MIPKHVLAAHVHDGRGVSEVEVEEGTAGVVPAGRDEKEKKAMSSEKAGRDFCLRFVS